MKRLITLILIVASVTIIQAKRITVEMPLLITKEQSNLIGDKIDELSLTVLSIKREHLTLGDVINRELYNLADEDANHRVYTIEFDGTPDSLTIDIKGRDIMLGNERTRKSYFGVLENNRGHFVVVQTDFNKALLKQLLNKKGDKVRFERVFEYVPEVFPVAPTEVSAVIIKGEDIRHNRFLINGDNKLNHNNKE